MAKKYAYIIKSQKVIPSSMMKYDYWFTSQKKACKWARDVHDELIGDEFTNFYVKLYKVDAQKLGFGLDIIADDAMYYFQNLEDTLKRFCIESNEVAFGVK